jgi:class 3 adenylate cyclase/tetratricopeptide (TPR) repeat protein
MSDQIETLTSYVPGLVADRLASKPEPPTEPMSESLPAAVLLAEISGFTTLTERLAQQGATGTQELAQRLNSYFGQLVDLIIAHRGDVVRLSGDTLLALWPARAGLKPDLEEDLGTATHRAVECGLAMQQCLIAQEMTAENNKPSLKLAVGTGQVSTLHLGGIYKRWEFLVTGRPVRQVEQAEDQAQPGDVIISPEAWALVRDDCTGDALSSGHVRLTAIHSLLPQRSPAVPSPPPEAESGLQAYIPGAVLTKLATGIDGSPADLRQITVLSIHLPKLTHRSPLNQIQKVTCALQTTLYSFEGSLNTLEVDEGGTTVGAALGLPPLTHEDDPTRGVRAALAMQSELDRLGLPSTIGVTTGLAFCGAIGSLSRRGYTVIGDVVNRAVDLMDAASHQQLNNTSSVLCDEATYRAAQPVIAFEAGQSAIPHGDRQTLAVYHACRPEEQPERRLNEMVGRVEEKTTLIEGLQGLLRGHPKRIVIIEGEAGLGKTRLAGDLINQAEMLGVASLMGRGDAIEAATPYYAWRPVFKQLFHLASSCPKQEQQEQVLKQLEGKPKWLRLAPLLNAVLPLDLPDNVQTAQMTGEVRASNTHDLLAHLLQAAAARSPQSLILEDVNWFDSASWALLRLVAHVVQPLLLIVLTEPGSDRLPAEYQQLREDPATEHLRLEPLSKADVLTFVSQRLEVNILPEPVARLLQDKANGHPFYSEELAYALRDRGLIEISNGACRLAPGVEALDRPELSGTVEQILASRIECLAPPELLALKVASVIGRIFSLNDMHRVYPIETDKPGLAKSLETLRRLDFTRPASPESETTYLFKHPITQEVAYRLVEPDLRRQVHRAVAEYLEHTHADHLTSFYPLLAYHLSRANEVAKAVDYLEKAGEQALRSYANPEAIDHFDRLLDLIRANPNLVAAGSLEIDAANPPKAIIDLAARIRQARWERHTAEAHYRLDQLAESRQHAQQALARLGWPVPVTRRNLAFDSLGQMLRQLYLSFRPGWFGRPAPLKQEALREGAGTALHLARTLHLANEPSLLPYINASLRALNLAQAAGSVPETALACANMCLVASLVPFQRLARNYRERAREMALRNDDLPALASVLQVTSLYDLGVGDWSEVEDSLEYAADIFGHIGDQRQWEGTLSNLAGAAYHQGRFGRSGGLRAEIFGSAHQRGDEQIQTWAQNGLAESKLRLSYGDRTGEVVIAAKMALSLLADKPEHWPETIRGHGLLAVAYLRQGHDQLARASADIAARLIAQSPPTTPYMLEGYAGVAESYLALWKKSDDQLSSGWRNLSKAARQVCTAFLRFAQVFPIGQPRAWLWRGLCDWLSGEPDKARTAWQKSLAAAERLAMPYEQGLAHYQIGLHLPLDAAARRDHLNRAADIFTQLDTAYDFGRVQKALALKAEH